MKIIYGPRRNGATQELMKISAETQSIIITFNKQTAKDIYSRALKLGYNIPMPISYTEAMKIEFSDRSYLIDNCDEILYRIFRSKRINGIAVHTTDVEYLNYKRTSTT